MGSKMAILILGLLAMLLIVSSQVAARDLNGGEVVKETNAVGDSTLAGGGYFPGRGGFFPGGGGYYPGGGFPPRQGYCRFGCCRWAYYWWGGCLRCCNFRG